MNGGVSTENGGGWLFNSPLVQVVVGNGAGSDDRVEQKVLTAGGVLSLRWLMVWFWILLISYDLCSLSLSLIQVVAGRGAGSVAGNWSFHPKMQNHAEVTWHGGLMVARRCNIGLRSGLVDVLRVTRIGAGKWGSEMSPESRKRKERTVSL